MTVPIPLTTGDVWTPPLISDEARADWDAALARFLAAYLKAIRTWVATPEFQRCAAALAPMMQPPLVPPLTLRRPRRNAAVRTRAGDAT